MESKKNSEVIWMHIKDKPSAHLIINKDKVESQKFEESYSLIVSEMNEFVDKFLNYYNEDEEKVVLRRINLKTNNKNLKPIDADSYASPYDIAYLKSTPYYTNGENTILLVSRVFSDSYGIVTMDGQYIFDAIFDRVVL